MDEITLSALRAHYGRLLSLPRPWCVKAVEEHLEEGFVALEVEWPKGMRVCCPDCKEMTPIHDHQWREWRHLDVMEFKSVVRAQVPRCECATHGVKLIELPWAEPMSRCTRKFEAHAIEILLASRSWTDAADLLKVSWGKLQRIVDAAVARGIVRRKTDGITRVGLDEKSFGRGQDYVSIMTDIDGSRVLEVVPGRSAQSARELWEALPEQQRKEVKAAAMDMGEGFIAGTRTAAPQADIVHDKYHVSALLNEAVDKTRREEHRALQAKGDDTLTDTKWLWLKGAQPKEAPNMHFEELLESKLRTSRAWYHKELFTEFWIQPDRESGHKFFKAWFGHARRSKLEAVKTTALTLKKHLDGLLSYFEHHITNALTEGFNSRIQQIKADARGFRSFVNYRTRILFLCGKLNMIPGLEGPSH